MLACAGTDRREIGAVTTYVHRFAAALIVLHAIWDLKTPFQTELHSSRAVRIQRMQKGRARNAVSSAALKARRIHGSGITAGNVIPTAARIIRVVDSKLGLVEDIEKLRPKLKFARLTYFETLQQGQVEIQPIGVIQKVPTGISKGQPPRRNELGRIQQNWADAGRVSPGDIFGDTGRGGYTACHVRVGGGDPKATRNPGVIGERDAGVASAVNDGKGRA